jgi:hypothetical protein
MTVYGHSMDGLKCPVRWLKAHWDEEDVLFFFEIDEDGWCSDKWNKAAQTASRRPQLPSPNCQMQTEKAPMLFRYTKQHTVCLPKSRSHRLMATGLMATGLM